MASAKVLIVDDEIDFADALAARLDAREISADTVPDGPSAIEKVQQTAYDAVVLDLAMPGMDGLETLQRLLEINANLQVIMLTGYGSIEQGVQAVKHGAVDFLEKPAEIEKLVGKVLEAQTRTLELFEKGLEDKIDGIMRKKSW
jgi:DNA-binding NtrC family response regulator